MVKLGFVGVGNMGQMAHLQHYAAITDCEITAIAEPRQQLAQAVAAKYGAKRVYPDATSMLASEQLDGLVAIQPFERHGSLITPLYCYNLPLLTEKPLASSVETGAAMIRQLKSWHMVGYHKRNDPAVTWARDRMKSSGRLRYVRIMMPPGDWIAGGFADLIRSDERPPNVSPDAMPENIDAREYIAFVNYYIHQVNLLRYLLDEPYEVVFADKHSRLLVAETASGVTATIEMAPFETAQGWQEAILIGFDDAAIKLQLPAPLADHSGTAQIMKSDGTQVHAPLRAASAMRMQAENFVAAIQGKAKPACEAAEALEDLRIARDWLELKASRSDVA